MTTSVLFTKDIVILDVAGPVWIMCNLNYNMMLAEQTTEYMLEQKDKGL